MNKETILLLEDDPVLMKANRGILEMNGYRVLACSDIGEAWAAAREETPALMVLDVMLPDGKGTDFYREYRAGYGSVPALFLTVMKESWDIAEGYGAGGVDYIIKPFPMEQLLMKVDSLLESYRAAGEKIHIGPLRLDCIANAAFLNGKDLLLTPKEYSVLEYLARNRNRYVTSKELYTKVWGMEAVDTRPVKQHIRTIRDKLGDNGPVAIDSEQGKGYRLKKIQT